MELQLVLSDLLISLLWVWSGSILRYFAYTFFGLGMHTGIGLLKLILAVLYISFSWLGKATNGGAYNPLMVLCHAISGSFSGFLFVIFVRIPAQAFGWACVQGDHTTKEHLLVYWLAPVEGALLGVWACSLFVDLKKHKEHHQTSYKVKSE
ncbi:probable aquaporin SIP2-1 [Dioscorea cayenensis subsp. rotundata]|uniref:Probable aquaporin SIP2-1 n=1 Tax=Dioscorea cayennensis subsp. rotundata TaxID=55577 RepID=A0AB40BKS1_DIOCR|nr:probable aquaporin SIP2-1 [Dioscorea cayenensis subsp. rotundata]